MEQANKSTIRPLIPELEAIARQELNETPEALENGLRLVNEYLDASPHIKARRDDQFLVTFLRGCKYDIEQVKQKLETYYKVRSQIPDFFKERDVADEKYKRILRLGWVVQLTRCTDKVLIAIFLKLGHLNFSIVLPFPTTDPIGGPRVFVIRITSYSPKEYKIEDLVKTIGIVTEIWSNEDDNLVVAGQVSTFLIYIVQGHPLNVHLFSSLAPVTKYEN